MNRQINLLHVTKADGGTGTYVLRLAEALNKERYKITVVCLADRADELAAKLSRIPNVRAISLPMKDYIEPFSDLGLCIKLARIIRNDKFNLIHAHTSKPGFFTRLAAVGTGIPVIYRPASFAFDDALPKRRAKFYAFLERFAARYLTERIVAVCQGERELARRFSVGNDNQFIIIHTGIPLERFDVQVDRDALRSSLGVPANVNLVGTIARLTEQKAPQDFVRAAALMHAREASTHFLWVGDGYLELEMKALARLLGLDDVFHFVGYRDDIPAVLKTLDCFVLSSHWEGFSIAVLEAMAAGLPIVATRVMGAAEAICENETGFLVPIGDVRALADAMEKMVKDLPAAQSMGRAARMRAESEFPISKMLERVDRLYQEVVQKYTH